MPALRSHAVLDQPADAVWAVVRDVAGISRWFPAMTASEGDQEARTVTLGDGSRLEERIVLLDDDQRRLRYQVVGGDLPVEHHLGTVDVLPVDAGRSVVVYSTDVTPEDLAPAFDAAVGEAVAGLGAFLADTDTDASA